MSTFEEPDYIYSNGARTYVRGPNGEPLGDGYHDYPILTGLTADGQEVSMLMGLIGAAKVILSPTTYEPLVGRLEGEGVFWEYMIRDGRLYGYRYFKDGITDLGAWPPADVTEGEVDS